MGGGTTISGNWFYIFRPLWQQQHSQECQKNQSLWWIWQWNEVLVKKWQVRWKLGEDFKQCRWVSQEDSIQVIQWQTKSFSRCWRWKTLQLWNSFWRTCHRNHFQDWQLTRFHQDKDGKRINVYDWSRKEWMHREHWDDSGRSKHCAVLWNI